MNTIRSTWLGWGFLIVAGGGSYYFAKRSINADRQARHESELRRQHIASSLEATAAATPKPASTKAPSDKSRKGKDAHPAHHAGHPSGEASQDPAPAADAPGGSGRGQSKFEPTEPYRSKKGDRFS